MVQLGDLVVIRDMDFPERAIMAMVIRRHFEYPVVSVCLVSELDFSGNGRFKIGAYWVYPSIQSVAWNLQCQVLKASFLERFRVKIFLAWPALSGLERSNFAESLGSNYLAAEKNFDKTDFESEVLYLSDSSEDFFRCLDVGEFLDGQALNYWAKTAPKELLLDMHGRPDLAMATRDGLGERHALYKTISRGGEVDALRLLLRNEAASSKVRGTEKIQADESDYAAAARNLGINTFILRKQSTRKSHKSIDIDVGGVAIRVHSVSSRKQPIH